MLNLILFWCIILQITTTVVLAATTTGHPYTIRLPGRPYETSWDDDDDDCRNANAETKPSSGRRSSKQQRGGLTGTGRELDIFDSRSVDSRGGAGVSSARSGGNNGSRPFYNRISPTERYYYQRGHGSAMPGKGQRQMPRMFQSAHDWWSKRISPNLKEFPKIAIRVEPTTKLKIRKTFRPLKTIVRIGADYNTQLGVWQFKSSWEDAIIGSKLTLAGRELQLSKSWQLSVGAVEDLVTRLRFRAAIDLTNFKAYARIGFRTERLSPINVMEGFTLMRRLPLDGGNGNVKLEVKANFALPEPEIEYSTETQRSLVGMGDIEISIDELNLLLDY